MPPTVSACSAKTVNEPAGFLSFVKSRNGRSGSIGPAGRTISRVQHAGIESHRAVFQMKAAVERQAVFFGACQLHGRRRQPRVGRGDHFDQPVAQRLGILHLRERILAELLRRPFAEQPRPLAGEERSGVRVRGGDGDVGGGNAGSRRRQRADVVRQRLRHADQVADDERGARGRLAETRAPWP